MGQALRLHPLHPQLHSRLLPMRYLPRWALPSWVLAQLLVVRLELLSWRWVGEIGTAYPPPPRCHPPRMAQELPLGIGMTATFGTWRCLESGWHRAGWALNCLLPEAPSCKESLKAAPTTLDPAGCSCYPTRSGKASSAPPLPLSVSSVFLSLPSM